MASGPLVGLDIGTQQIKAVELRPGKAGLTVTALGVAPTPAGVMQNNIITDPRAMAQAVRQLIRESGITAKRVVGSVAGQSAVVVRIIEVPKMTDAELKETMKWEVERHVPFAPSEVQTDYQPLTVTDPAADASPNMEVLLAVAQQDIVNNFVETVEAARLTPAAIDIEPLAAGRAVLDLVDGRTVVRPVLAPGTAPAYDSGAHETVAVVVIGASNTDISIFQDGELTFPRSLPLAGDSLTRAIADMRGVSLDQAEREKRELGAVQLDRMGLYTGTAYGDDLSYETPAFQEEEPDFVASSLPDDDEPLGNPFGLDEPTFGQPPAFQDTPEPALGDVERTQPIERRTLNLARRPETDAPPPFVPPADADTFLPGAADENALRDEVFQAIAPVLGELATELRRSLDYYRSRAQGRSVDRVVLAGGTALLGNIAPFLQNELQVPVAIANPLQGLGVASKHYDPAYLQTIAPVFAIAVGLAARDAVFDANPAPRPTKPARAPKTPTAATGNVTNPPTS